MASSLEIVFLEVILSSLEHAFTSFRNELSSGFGTLVCSVGGRVSSLLELGLIIFISVT